MSVNKLLVVIATLFYTMQTIQTNNARVDLPPASWFTDQIFEKYSAVNDTIKIRDIENIMTILNIDIDYPDQTLSDTKNYSSCYSADQLLEIHNVKNNEITKNDFIQISPSLIWMSLTPECLEGAPSNETNNCILDKEKYIFGSLSIFIIWLCSFTAVFIVGKLNQTKYLKDYLVLCLRSLAVGTLLGDAFLHIIPSALGIHEDEEEEMHDHSMDSHQVYPIWKMFIVQGTILFLWMLECFMEHDHDHEHHGHSHHHEENSSSNRSNEEISTVSSPVDLIEIKADKRRKQKNFKDFIKNVHSNGWIAYLGDCIHKITDGLAIGAAFSESLSLGLSTSLAILFHEIPHEIGDFGILISSGFTHCSVLILITISSLSSYIGFIIIASISPGESAREWIFAITAGVFIYISMTVMIPKLRDVFKKDSISQKRNPLKILFVLISFFIGWLVMLLLAIYEDKIKLNVSDNC